MKKQVILVEIARIDVEYFKLFYSYTAVNFRLFLTVVNVIQYRTNFTILTQMSFNFHFFKIII